VVPASRQKMAGNVAITVIALLTTYATATAYAWCLTFNPALLQNRSVKLLPCVGTRAVMLDCIAKDTVTCLVALYALIIQSVRVKNVWTQESVLCLF